MVDLPANPDRIEATCEGCGTKLEVPTSFAGKRGRCPQCANLVTFHTGDDASLIQPDDIKVVPKQELVYDPQRGAYILVSPQRGSGMGIASFVMGLIALVTCWIPLVNLFSGLLAFVGVLLGVGGMARDGRKGFAIAGLILGLLAMAVVILMFTAIVGLFV